MEFIQVETLYGGGDDDMDCLEEIENMEEQEMQEMEMRPLLLEQVEAAGMAAIADAMRDNTPDRAGWVVDILERLSIV